MPNRHQRPGRWALLAVVMALACLVGGCGDDADRDAETVAETGYHLDPPELGLTLVPDAAPGVPVLCYHYFRSGFDAAYLLKVFGSVVFGMPALGPREFWTTPVGEFEKHLRYFRDTGTRVMTLDEVAGLIDAGRPLPERAVVLTIDDADESVHRLAWPLLRKYGMRAHLFVPSAHVGKRWSELQVCSWDQLREMADSGTIILGSHTHDLHYKVKADGRLEPVFWNPTMIGLARRGRTMGDLARYRRERPDGALPPGAESALNGRWSAVAADLLASRSALAAGTGADATWLAWPYGFAHGDLDSIARLVGFRGTVSLQPAPFARADSLAHPGRYTLTAKSTLEMIDEIVAAAPRLSRGP